VIFAQIPSPDVVVQSAASHGWEAALLAFLVLSILASFGYMMKKIVDDARTREDRMGSRISALELEIRTELFSQIRTSSEVIVKIVATMERLCALTESTAAVIRHLEGTMLVRPCLLNVAQQGLFLQELDDLCRKHMTSYPPSLTEKLTDSPT
jgi:hypothetical protein